MSRDIIISEENLEIKELKGKIFHITGISKKSSSECFFDMEYSERPKNFVFTSNIKTSMDFGDYEIQYYMRYLDCDNYSSLVFKNGQYIKYFIKGKGEITFQTSFLKISNSNIFEKGADIIISLFEDTLIVLIDNEKILHIDQTPNSEGKTGIHFISEKGQDFDIKLKNPTFSENIIHFEPILNMPKKSDVFFMQANDFYENNAYEWALFYYRKGLLYGKGNDAVYNRMGNLMFLFEEFYDAEKYYSRALSLNDKNDEYKNNYIRSLIRQNRNSEFIPLVLEQLETGKYDDELLIDYSKYLIDIRNFDEAYNLLEKVSDKSRKTAGFKTKYGKCLIGLDRIEEGAKYLYEASVLISRHDPSGAVVILKYLSEKFPTGDSVLLLCQILMENEEFEDVYQIIKQTSFIVDMTTELFEILLTSILQLGFYEQALNEFNKLTDNLYSPYIQLLKIKTLIANGKYNEALSESENLEKKLPDESVDDNQLISLKLHILSHLEKYDNCKDLFNKAEKGKPFYDKVEEEYGKILVDLKDFDNALKILENAYKTGNHSMELSYNLALTYNALEYFADSKELLLELYYKARSPQIVYALATTLFYTRDYQEGLSILLENLENMPREGKIDNLLGNYYMALGKIANAQKFYYSALELDKDHPEYALNLAESFYKLNDFDNALMITKQLVTEGVFDRAKTLHLKIKSHLYEIVKCDICGREWEINKNYQESDINNEDLSDLPLEAPAGKCEKCGKTFCRTCVSGIPIVEAECPECEVKLQYDNKITRLIARQYLPGKGEEE